MNIWKLGRVVLGVMLLAAAIAPKASATLIVSGSVGGTPTGGSVYVNFDSLTAFSNATQATPDGITVSFSGLSKTYQGTTVNVSAAPYLSNNNGTLFGDAANGPDTTTYLSANQGALTMTLPNDSNYIGLLWGSVDTYNTLYLYENNMLVGAVTNLNFDLNANGSQQADGTYYVNINSDVAFDKVVIDCSGSTAFEIDNVAYDQQGQEEPEPTVPEPASLSLIGLGLAGVAALRRRAKSARSRA
jgi:hypothetical protein